MNEDAETRGGTRESLALEQSAGARVWKPHTSLHPDTPACRLVNHENPAKISPKRTFAPSKIASPLRGAAIDVACWPSIRKKIIRHAMWVFRQQHGGGNGLRRGRSGAFALLHQPAREHRTRIFLKPLVQQRANFLSQICSMAQPRELVALQRTTRSRKQKLPRGLGLGTVHRSLLTGWWVR